VTGKRGEADFAHSLTDLMSGVAVTFLVIAAIFMVQASQAKQKVQQEKRHAEALAKRNEENAVKYEEMDEREQRGIAEIEKLRASLEGRPSIELLYDRAKDPRLLTIVFDRDSLRFDSGACKVDRDALERLRATLRDIFPPICAAVGGGLQKSIALEGHTDNQPPLGVACKAVAAARSCYRHRDDPRCLHQGLESNVQLSAARAQYVFFEARSALKDNPAVAECLDRSFLVAGRGPMEPMAPPDGGDWRRARSEADNEKNRRVVIKVRVTTARDQGTP
jgi:flagellar motor protein MotB